MEEKVCKQCNRLREITFFRKMRKSILGEFTEKLYYYSICKECDDENLKIFRATNPWHKKVRDTVAYHARKRKMTAKQFLKEFDLSYEFLERLFQNAFEADWCQQCEKPFSEFKDKHNFELDIINRNLDPTRSNLRVIHGWCNNAKGNKPPDVYDKECKEWKRGQNAQTVLDILSEPKIKISLSKETRQFSFL